MKNLLILISLTFFIFHFSSCSTPDCSGKENLEYLAHEDLIGFYKSDTSILTKNGQKIKFWMSKSTLSYTTQDLHGSFDCKWSLNYKMKIYYRRVEFKSSDSLLNKLVMQYQSNVHFGFNEDQYSGVLKLLGVSTINGIVYDDLYQCVMNHNPVNRKDSIQIRFSKKYGLVDFIPVSFDKYQR